MAAESNLAGSAQRERSDTLVTPIHIQPTAPLAERVLLPGDPGRALRLAQALLSEPKMFNHHRGLWGYTGAAADGDALTVQSTGIGGPSAAIVISELADLGAEQLLRVGTCGALDPGLSLGDLLIATEAIATDGTSRALGAPARVTPSADLLSCLLCARDARTQAGPVGCTDLFYDGADARKGRWGATGAVAVDMESATLFALAAKRRLAAACLLVVSDVLLPARVRIAPDALHEAEHRMGELAGRALFGRDG